MNKQDALSQQLRELRTAEAELRRQLVDPVTELLEQGEKLNQLVVLAPADYSAVREMMTEVIYLRQVIRDLLVPLIETQTQIRQVEAELKRAQAPSAGDTSASHPTSSMSQPANPSQRTNGQASEQSE